MLRPKQKVSKAEKNKQWIQDNALWGNKISTISTVDRNHIDELYQIVTGKINLMNYRHVTNPYGDSNNTKNYPAKLINYDIISPMVMQILSEFSKRIYQPNVYAKNTEIDTIREQYEIEEFTKILQQDFVNYHIKAGNYVPGQTDEQGQPIEEPQHPDLIKKKKMTIRDVKASEGQNMLEYILTCNYAQMVWRQLMFDFIVTNRTFSRRGIQYDEVIYRRIKPQNLSFYASNHIDFIEDAEVVRYTDVYTLNEIVDMLTGMEGFDADLIDTLETQVNNGTPNGFFESFSRNFYNKEVDKIGNNKLFVLSHVQWTAYDKIGRIKTQDIFGKIEYVEVDETYVETEGDEIEWRWCACVYEAYVLQNEFVIGGGKVEISRAKFNSPHTNKKCYNGKVYMYHTGVKFDSIVEKLYAYQELYNIMKFKIQYTINKNKDKLAVIPIGLLGHFKDEEDSILEYDAITGVNSRIPIKNKEQSSIAKALYYADSTQMLFIDETSPTAQLAANMLKDIDLSLGNYIQYLISYATQIKEEAGELIGFNRYRRADINTNDRVSNVETAQYTGSLIIEEYFTSMKELQDSDCQCLLDYANVAYREGKKASFIRSDGEQVIFNLEPYALENAQFGIFAKDSGTEKQKFDELKQFALTLSQNSSIQAPIVRMLASDGNLNKIVTDIEAMEDEIYRREQEKQQNDMQMNQAQIEAEQVRYDAEMQFKYYKVDEDNRVKVETHYSSLLNGGNNDIEIIKLRQEALKVQQEAAFRQQEMLLKNKEIDVKSKDSDNKVKIATVNRQQ